MASPQLVAHVPIPSARLRRALEQCAVEGFHGNVCIEIRISPEVVVDRIQTHKANATKPERNWSRQERDVLVARGMDRILAELGEMKADSVSITGHFNDGRMLQLDLKEVTK